MQQPDDDLPPWIDPLRPDWEEPVQPRTKTVRRSLVGGLRKFGKVVAFIAVVVVILTVKLGFRGVFRHANRPQPANVDFPKLDLVPAENEAALHFLNSSSRRCTLHLTGGVEDDAAEFTFQVAPGLNPVRQVVAAPFHIESAIVELDGARTTTDLDYEMRPRAVTLIRITPKQTVDVRPIMSKP